MMRLEICFEGCGIIRHVKMNDQMCCLCEVELSKAFEHYHLESHSKRRCQEQISTLNLLVKEMLFNHCIEFH